MLDWGLIAAALAVGFFGSGHCVGMCGGIAGALGMATPGSGQQWPQLLGYQFGRLGSYTLMGVLAGALGAAVEPLLPSLRLVAGLLLIAMGLYVGGWWYGLTWLEKGGAVFWRRLQPLSAGLLPVRSPIHAVGLGAIWGWLPCGLVYSALAFALTQGSPAESGLAMLAFGIGTLPAMLATGVAAGQMKQVLQGRGMRTVMAICLLAFGVWTAFIALQHAGHNAAGHSHHGAHSAVDHSSMDHSGHGESSPEKGEASDEPVSPPEDAGHHHHHHGDQQEAGEGDAG